MMACEVKCLPCQTETLLCISARNSIINNRPTALTIPSEVIFDPNRESLFIGNSRANVVTIFYGPDAVLFKSSFD